MCSTQVLRLQKLGFIGFFAGKKNMKQWFYYLHLKLDLIFEVLYLQVFNRSQFSVDEAK